MAAATPAPSPSPSVDPKAAAARALLQWQRLEYAKEMWYFVAALIGAFTLAHIVTLILYHSRKSKRASHSKEDNDSVSINNAVSWRRLPDALVTGFNIAAFRYTVPIGRHYVLCMMELLLSGAYLATILTCALINGTNMTSWNQRVAHIAYFQMSLLPSLAGKNSLISLLTGVSHEKLNFLHRAAARSCFILILMHSFSHASLTSTAISTTHYTWGVVGSAAFGFIFIFSLRPVRQYAFEAFRWTHPIYVIMLYVGAYRHQPTYGYYLYAAFATWGLERVIRTFRALYFNVGQSRATITTLSSGYVEVTMKRKMNWRAGQHVQLTIPAISTLPFEDHPFTISSIPESGEIRLIIRRMGGFTKKLADLAHKEPGKEVVAVVDGPYGNPPDLNDFSTTVLIAGGSGISYTLPLLLDVIKHAKGNNSAVQRVVFVWCVRDSALLQSITPTIRDAVISAPANLAIELRIHVTGANDLVVPLEGALEAGSGPGSGDRTPEPEKLSPILPDSKIDSDSAWIKPLNGRPNIRDLIAEEIDIARGPVSVDVSGPAALSKAVRQALRSDIAGPIGVLKGRPTVTLHVEAFGESPTKQ